MKGASRRVGGVDAIMIYAASPARLAEWYARHLGIATTWNPEDGNYYGDIGDAGLRRVHFGIYPAASRQGRATARRRARPGPAGVMVNYRVAHLDSVLRRLRAHRIHIRDVQHETYGVFAHLDDPEGNPVELWMPQPQRPPRRRSGASRRHAK